MDRAPKGLEAAVELGAGSGADGSAVVEGMTPRRYHETPASPRFWRFEGSLDTGRHALHV